MTNQTFSERGAVERLIFRRTKAGPVRPGFAGPGHTAVEIIGSDDLRTTDPFVLLMDDRLDFVPGQTVGAAHPHAGLETVTLILEGSLDDPAEGLLEEGDLAWMSAGRGVIHNEGVMATGRARILQLWIALPGSLRSLAPDFELVPLRTLPIRREPGVEARLYSGRSGRLASPTRNRVPVTIIDFHFQPGARAMQGLPGAYTGIVFMDAGSLTVGGKTLEAGDIGWLDRTDADETDLALQAGPNGARVLLFAGKPIGETLVQRGPFVAGSEAEIVAYHRHYQAGDFQHMSDVVSDDKAARTGGA